MDLPTIFLVQQEIKRGLNNLDSSRTLANFSARPCILKCREKRSGIDTLSDSFTRELFIFLPFLRDSVIGESRLIDRVTSRDANTKNLSLSLSLSLSCLLNPNSSIIHEDSKIAESREYRHLRLAFAPLITQLLYN